jgi:hypothetical protein
MQLTLSDPTDLGEVREWLRIADDAGFTDDSPIETTLRTLTVRREAGDS